MQHNAIVIKNAYKSYSKEDPPILDGLHMTVSRGNIYGLLGASGCGKTTLLSCIVGIRKLDEGEIWVLGGRPGQTGSGIPGPRVGYMPQETSLVGEFSVIEALYYFGRINGLEDSDICKRFGFISELLQLPPMDRMVKHLSGGQQRRVSFAVSLLHKPELLILDEPTVGLDPILRENIWQFLVKLTKEDGTAVVITTHYIEETKFANRIGLLRYGKLLAETTPTALLTRFNCQRLEEAFLILSQRQEERRNRRPVNVNDDHGMNLEELSTQPLPASDLGHCSNNELSTGNGNEFTDSHRKENEKHYRVSSIYWKIFKALMIKNFLQFLRHPSGIFFAIIFPLFQTIIFFYSVGGDPKGIVVAIVNDEASDCDSGRNLGKVVYKPNEHICDYIDISCRFLHGFDESIMTKQYFNTIEEATHAVQLGKAAATMYFGRNFSIALQSRRDFEDYFGEDDIFSASEIHMALDMGDCQIGYFLKINLVKKFFDTHGEIVSNCNIPKKYAAMPISFKEPVFGKMDQKYLDFMVPGFMQISAFILATAVSAAAIISDRAQGVWDRSLVQGVTTSAILFSHILMQMLVIIIQVSVVLVTVFAYFQMSCRGSFAIIILLILLSGISGMCYGFLISVLCTSHSMANVVSSGSFFPLMLLGGSVWPLEGMPTYLRYISYFMPSTVPTLALRALMDKGYSIFEFEVYSGFCVTICWILIFVAVCLIGLRKKA